MSTTPILPGFHPDPSICRVGENYYLATSSFEYAPGVPVYRSTDLLEWTPVGHALATAAQPAVKTGMDGANGGIYAPTLRHHGGRFWMTTTNVHEVARGHLITHAEDPAGPWSEPVYAAGLIGIDPDLAWDEDGVALLTWSDVLRGGISQVDVDPETGASLSDVRTLWHGTGGGHVEGPHVFRRGEWWYLMAAEGGTGPGHMETIARSRSPRGPFESAPSNPFLTHRSTAGAVQSTGHADLVERPDGTWALVHLGTRSRGSFPRWHVNGRETFLAGVDWVDGWPVVNEDRFEVPPRATGFVDDFSGPGLHPRWVAPGAHPASFAQLVPDGVRLTPSREAGAVDSTAILSVRAADEAWEATASGEGDIALSVGINDRHRAVVQCVGGTVTGRLTIGPLSQELAAAQAGDGPLVIRTELVKAALGAPQGPDVVVLGHMVGGEFEELARFDGRYLSTEVAGGFTGRMIGVEALGAAAVLTRFSYAPLDTSDPVAADVDAAGPSAV